MIQWNLKYINDSFQLGYATLFAIDAYKNIQSTVTTSGIQITSPFFKLRLTSISNQRSFEFYTLPSFGPYKTEHSYSYLSFVYRLFDNQGSQSYAENLLDGIINISKNQRGYGVYLAELIETSVKDLNATSEIGVVWSGLINIQNAQNPETNTNEYVTNSNQQLYTTYKT